MFPINKQGSSGGHHINSPMSFVELELGTYMYIFCRGGNIF